MSMYATVSPLTARVPLHGGQHAVGGERAAVGQQRPADDGQVGQQLVPAAVVPPRLVRPLVRDPGPGVDQLGLDAGQLQPDRLVLVQLLHPRVQQGQVGRIHLDGGEQFVGCPGDDRRAGQGQQQLVDLSDGQADRRLALQREHLPGDVGGHVRVAVPVAADPAAQQQGSGLRGELHPVLGHRRGQVVRERRNGLADDGVQVEQGVAGLVDRGRPELPDLVGLPQQVDDLGQFAVLPGPGRGSGGVWTSRMSASACSLSSTDRRLASVGCAVKTGCTSRASTAVRSASVPSVWTISSTTAASAPSPTCRARSSRTRSTCSAPLASWK